MKSKVFTTWLSLFAIALLSAAAVIFFHNSAPAGQQDAFVNKPVKPEKAKESPPPKENNEQPIEPKKPVPLSRRIVEYHINVQLDAGSQTLSGSQAMTWTHPGHYPVQDLYFHLYPNAFESKNTTFMKESGGKLRSDKMQDGSFGNMRITSIQTADGQELISRMTYVQPDDGNPNDHTLMKIRLDRPVQPGEKVTLLFKYTVQLPKVFARMGYSGDFVMAGQWFPKIAVYETAGTRNRKDEGWNLHQYHGNSEFYADFGIYSVAVTVPDTYLVAATGFPTQPPTARNGMKTFRFYADDVHDFAWAASPHFIYAEQPFSTANIPGVRIKLYLDPKQKDLQDRYFTAAKKALTDYSKWYGEYPYSTLSIVVPPPGGNGAGGMEYPTLITAWDASDSSPDTELERVLVHEIGHQYWYGMVASNEFEEPWLDEGLTSYAEGKVMEKEYGAQSNLPVEASYVTDPSALNLNAWQYANGDHYADNVYIRAKLVLTDIERRIGSKQMENVLRTYFQQWKFKHPTTSDFEQSLEQVTRQNWDDYFQHFVYGGNMIDYSVDAVRSVRIRENGITSYNNTVIISKRGGPYNTVPILIHFSDGSSLKKIWDGSGPHMQYQFKTPAPIDWVMIDPNYSMVLENKHINNFMKTTVSEPVQVRWNMGAAKALETLLGWIAW
ncbi:M1 family metallopeptidase [Ferviditalea candida]